jgi:hypothetical protein
MTLTSAAAASVSPGLTIQMNLEPAMKTSEPTQPMLFKEGDIVTIVKYPPIPQVAGRSAEIEIVDPPDFHGCPLLQLFAEVTGLPPWEIWYKVIDVVGESHMAPHSWLRRVPDAWTPKPVTTDDGLDEPSVWP